MEVALGYQQTELGVIPKDWDLRQIGSVCKLINGRGFKPFEWKTSGLPIIRIQNLNGSDEFNFYNGPYNKKLEIKPGQLLFAWSGNRGTSFGPRIWQGPLGLLNYHTWKVQTDETKICKQFFLHALRHLTAFIEGSAHGASALVHTQKWEMEGFQFPLPPTKTEQEAIARALSDADALIETVKLLLAKKRYLKQGAMQELLTGKKRLPGFAGEWTEVRLANLGSFMKGSGVTKDEARTGTLPCIRYGEIYTRHNDYIKMFYSHISREVAATAARLRKGDILFAGSGETKADIGKCVAFIHDVEAYAGGDIVILRNEKADPTFLGFYLNTSLINRQKSSRGQGDAVVHISASALEDIRGTFPELPEQAAIASVLLEMDSEIAALEAKLAKARDLKQGMMHELLTGRIRLI
jgi:type I restriction enzyme S subunit